MNDICYTVIRCRQSCFAIRNKNKRGNINFADIVKTSFVCVFLFFFLSLSQRHFLYLIDAGKHHELYAHSVNSSSNGC